MDEVKAKAYNDLYTRANSGIAAGPLEAAGFRRADSRISQPLHLRHWDCTNYLCQRSRRSETGLQAQVLRFFMDGSPPSWRSLDWLATGVELPALPEEVPPPSEPFERKEDRCQIVNV